MPPNPQAAAGLCERGHLALLHIVFAVAVQLGSTAHWEEEHRSEAYFSRARVILGNPLDIPIYTARNILALLLIALYLIEVNRRDAVYMTVSTVLPLAAIYSVYISVAKIKGIREYFGRFIFLIAGCYYSLGSY